ncbi:hypothetical protein E2C01_071247 [Portunus trituberculatus]|uniref:Uncharacterized protein n=1 Tax=Portunus trituberculatus TaxID=210409 RepID=A0A5B7I3W2_PORTR|nr:hypothetical protein [Portunus trituberculatus]
MYCKRDEENGKRVKKKVEIVVYILRSGIKEKKKRERWKLRSKNTRQRWTFKNTVTFSPSIHIVHFSVTFLPHIHLPITPVTFHPHIHLPVTPLPSVNLPVSFHLLIHQQNHLFNHPSQLAWEEGVTGSVNKRVPRSRHCSQVSLLNFNHYSVHIFPHSFLSSFLPSITPSILSIPSLPPLTTNPFCHHTPTSPSLHHTFTTTTTTTAITVSIAIIPHHHCQHHPSTTTTTPPTTAIIFLPLLLLP